MTKRYEKYKDSGIAWIGEIPEHWEVIKMRFLCSFKTGDKDTINKEDDGKYPFYVRSPKIERINTFTYDGEAVLMAGDGVGAGKVIHYVNGKFDYHQRVYNFHKIKKVQPYLLYLFLQSFFSYKIEEGGAKNTVDSVRLPMIKDFPIVIPTSIEQEQIVKYLDWKCGEIDRIVEVRERQIKLLGELRTSVISRAVTRGLNPNAPLKDSGIDWIGQIPEHWEICRLKNACSLKGRIGWKGLRSEEFEQISYAYLVTGQDFHSAIIDWTKCYQISKERYDEDPYIQLSNGDLLITKDGTIGKIAKVSNMDKPSCLNSGIFVMKQTKALFEQSYLYWLLESSLLKEFNNYTSTGTTILHLYQNVFENMPFIIPSLSEQQQIAEYLDKKTEEIDSTIDKFKVQIDKLKEYRQALITEVVTGKIDIRSIEIPTPKSN
ncbi:restriction endonuclease subunit S [uncultured Bacteroides sp.]|uniref:restriction endonuclease subunit S n=1 Tax=uncultured Bacteroides sp. TaxID=162156 RepID=UPI0025AE0232|nr:restriction endonuclease subunit S [uncultured Bacteroides sp.]